MLGGGVTAACRNCIEGYSLRNVVDRRARHVLLPPDHSTTPSPKKSLLQKSVRGDSVYSSPKITLDPQH